MNLPPSRRYSPYPRNRRSSTHNAKMAIHIPVLEEKGKTA
jgi:hypothetical protein